MIVVSDTSCITNLSAIGRVALLRELFGVVLIPPAVRNELAVQHEILPDFFEVRAPFAHTVVAGLLEEPLELGEAEAIVLAEETHADYLLIDETAGRAVARARGLTRIGLLGVLQRAKERGLLVNVRPDLDALQAAGFWISPKLRQRFLSEMEEA